VRYAIVLQGKTVAAETPPSGCAHHPSVSVVGERFRRMRPSAAYRSWRVLRACGHIAAVVFHRRPIRADRQWGGRQPRNRVLWGEKTWTGPCISTGGRLSTNTRSRDKQSDPYKAIGDSFYGDVPPLCG
jgi:hypothetical protein